MKNSARFSRLILILLIVFVSSIVIPKYYWLIFVKSNKPPLIFYSSVKKDFLIGLSESKRYIRKDTEGNILSRKEFERLTPLFSFRQLIYRGEMPDSLDGIKLDYKDLRTNYIYLNLRPSDIYHYQIDLYPLIESKPDGPELAMPAEFFRIKDKIEFINCETNKINEKLSERFNRALVKAGFSFPAQKYFGNPTTMKSFDDGYFIIDSKGKMFHLKRVHNKPFVKEIPLPEDVQVEYMLVKELDLREFHGILITKDNRAFIVSMNNYKLIPIPIEGYDKTRMQLKLMGNIKCRIFTIIDKDSLMAFVTDRNYKLIDTYKYKWLSNKERVPGKILSVVTPFTLKMTTKDNGFYNFYFSFNGVYAFLFNILLVALTFFLLKKYKGREFKSQILDLVIVLLTGLYGFIGVLLIRDES